MFLRRTFLWKIPLKEKEMKATKITSRVRRIFLEVQIQTCIWTYSSIRQTFHWTMKTTNASINMQYFVKCENIRNRVFYENLIIITIITEFLFCSFFSSFVIFILIFTFFLFLSTFLILALDIWRSVTNIEITRKWLSRREPKLENDNQPSTNNSKFVI